MDNDAIRGIAGVVGGFVVFGAVAVVLVTDAPLIAAAPFLAAPIVIYLWSR
jgi:hypothetical protein